MQNDQGYAHRRGMGILGWVVGGLIVLLVLGFFVAALLWGGYYWMTGPTPAYQRPFFGWFFFPFGLFFIVFILFFAFRWFWFPWGRGYYYGRWYRHDEASQILRQRYARGEITRDQF